MKTTDLLAVLKALVEMYGPSTDYSHVAAITWADAEDGHRQGGGPIVIAVVLLLILIERAYKDGQMPRLPLMLTAGAGS